MLPSFRLIVITFLCGFAAVFAGLRLAASLNGALPVTTAHAGAHVWPAADGEVHVASVPAMFDTRFAIAAAPRGSGARDAVSPAAAVAAAVRHAAARRAAADAIPVAAVAEPAEQPSKPEGALAAVQPDPPADTVAPAEMTGPGIAGYRRRPTDPQQ